jgi:hypothetical protein
MAAQSAKRAAFREADHRDRETAENTQVSVKALAVANDVNAKPWTPTSGLRSRGIVDKLISTFQVKTVMCGGVLPIKGPRSADR